MTRGTEAARVCIFGTFDAGRHPRVAVLEQGLRASGADVVRCNVPWRASTAARVAAARQPWSVGVLALRLAWCWLRLLPAARRVGPVDIVVVGYLGVLDVHLARLLWRRATLVLDHLAPVAGTLEDRFGPTSPLHRLGRRLDRAATRRADLTVVDTDEHLTDLVTRGLVVPVGATEPWFAVDPVDRPAGPLRVVFYGLFTPLHGAGVIAEAVGRALDRGSRIEVTMIGTGQDQPACRSILAGYPQVTWRRWVDAHQLPRVVAQHDVCLGIFGTTAKARRVVPNKVYQGAAAGCAVVTSDTAAQRRVLGEAAVLVAAGDSAALADALSGLDEDRDRLAEIRRAGRALAEDAFRPRAVVAPLVEELGLHGLD